ncbi:PAS domain-containing protein [Rhodovibrionaceae bacterium A322]
MSQSPPFPPSRNDAIADVYALWLEMSEDDRPRFEDFNPLSLPEHLSGCWIVKVEQNPPGFRFCYFGRGLAKLIGKDRTNELVPEKDESGKRLEAQDLFSRIVETGEPGWRLGATELKTFDTQNTGIELIALPLFSEDKAQVTHILGFSVYMRSTGEEVD